MNAADEIREIKRELSLINGRLLSCRRAVVGPGAPHNILSATHTDTTAAAAVAGDIIYADATPKWTRLAAGGATQVLTMVAGAPAWAAGTTIAHNILSAAHGDSTPAAVVRGDIIIGSVAAPNTKWTRLGIGASTTYLAGGTEPSWATLNQAAVAGLTTTDGPQFAYLGVGGGSLSPDRLYIYPSILAASGTAYGMRLYSPTRIVAVNETNYLINGVLFNQSANIALGKIDSGYHAGLELSVNINDANFLGTLTEQRGFIIEHGISTGTGTIITSSGLSIYGYDAVGTITNKFGIRQFGANFKNYLEGKMLCNSLILAQGHPANYKAVYVDTDTGELYRIA